MAKSDQHVSNEHNTTRKQVNESAIKVQKHVTDEVDELKKKLDASAKKNAVLERKLDQSVKKQNETHKEVKDIKELLVHRQLQKEFAPMDMPVGSAHEQVRPKDVASAIKVMSYNISI